MTKRRRESKPERYVSKQQMSKFQRQKRITRITTIVGLVLIVATVSIIGVGYYSSEVRPYARTAMRVNGASFDMRYYINLLKTVITNNSQNGISDSTATGYVEQQIQQQELVKQAAEVLGLTVKRSDAETAVTKTGRKVTRESVDTQIAQDLFTQVRDVYFKGKLPATAPQANVQAMLLESQDAAQKVIDGLGAGASFDTIATDQSKNTYTKGQKGELGWVTADMVNIQVGSTKFGQAVLSATANTLSVPFYDDSVKKDYGWYVIRIKSAVEPADSTGSRNVTAEGILLGTEQEALDVIAKLNSGSDFDTLAKEVSQQPNAKTNGASLGSIDVTKAGGAFQAALFDLPVGQISAPIANNNSQTTGGYWVYRVTEKDDNKALTESQQTVLDTDSATKWYDQVIADPNKKVDILLTADMRVFALGKARS